MEKPRLITVVDDIQDAMDMAFHQHGRLTSDPVRATLILVEECGEAAAEALAITRRYTSTNMINRAELLYNELAQVAATAAAMMCNLKEGM